MSQAIQPFQQQPHLPNSPPGGKYNILTGLTTLGACYTAFKLGPVALGCLSSIMIGKGIWHLAEVQVKQIVSDMNEDGIQPKNEEEFKEIFLSYYSRGNYRKEKLD